MDNITKVIAIGIVECEDSKILMNQRYEPKNPKAHLKWEFLGGKNEFGESLEDTVKREILEEAGLLVSVGQMLPKCVHQVWEYPGYLQHTLVFCYVCKIVGGKLQTKDPKIAAFRKCSLEEVQGLDTLPGIADFLEIYRDSTYHPSKP